MVGMGVSLEIVQDWKQLNVNARISFDEAH